MAGITRIISAGALSILALGCMGPRVNWVGSWRGIDPIKAPPDTPAPVAKSMETIKLTISPDGSFMLFYLLPYRGQVEGGGKEISLRVEQIIDQTPKEPVEPFKVEMVSESEALLTIPSRAEVPIPLKREAQP